LLFWYCLIGYVVFSGPGFYAFLDSQPASHPAILKQFPQGNP
jgi:hypothetical protein